MTDISFDLYSHVNDNGNNNDNILKSNHELASNWINSNSTRVKLRSKDKGKQDREESWPYL